MSKWLILSIPEFNVLLKNFKTTARHDKSRKILGTTGCTEYFTVFNVLLIGYSQGNTTCPHYIYKCCKTSSQWKPPTNNYTPEPTPPYQPKPDDPNPTNPVPPYNPSPDTYPNNPSPPYSPPTDPYPNNPEPPTEPEPYPPSEEPPYRPETQPPYKPDHEPQPTEPSPDYHPKPDDPYLTNPPPPYHPPTDPYPPITSPPYSPNDYPKDPLPPPQPAPFRCGQRNPEGIGVRITGDQDGEAQFGEFPWMVAILKVETNEDEKKRNLYQCGGALITPQIVLTAAHCVKK